MLVTAVTGVTYCDGVLPILLRNLEPDPRLREGLAVDTAPPTPPERPATAPPAEAADADALVGVETDVTDDAEGPVSEGLRTGNIAGGGGVPVDAAFWYGW